MEVERSLGVVIVMSSGAMTEEIRKPWPCHKRRVAGIGTIKPQTPACCCCSIVRSWGVTQKPWYEKTVLENGGNLLGFLIKEKRQYTKTKKPKSARFVFEPMTQVETGEGVTTRQSTPFCWKGMSNYIIKPEIFFRRKK